MITHDELSDAEFFVLSSDYEGLSNALLEAMMMGLPCISTDCAGSSEIIQSGKMVCWFLLIQRKIGRSDEELIWIVI